jgi:hypothetical protein
LTSSYMHPVKAENPDTPLAIANAQSLAPATAPLGLDAEPLNLAAGPLDLTAARAPYLALCSPISSASDTCEDSESFSGSEQDHENARKKAKLSKKRHSPRESSRSRSSSRERKRQRLEGTASFSGISSEDHEDPEMPTVAFRLGTTKNKKISSCFNLDLAYYAVVE